MANEYSASVTPFRATIYRLPVSTFAATIISLVLYIISVILILASNCPMNARVAYFLAFLVVAVLATCCMAAINMMYARYHFNCLSLSVSLLYSGSAALVILGLIVTAFNGLCVPKSSVKPQEFPLLLSQSEEISTEHNDAIVLSEVSRKATYRDLLQTCDDSQSLFKSGHVANYFIWIMSAIAVASQIVAHYYYG